MTITPKRPVLRWHGGKWILAPWIISHFPKHKVYTECFGGAASVLIRKSRSYAEVYNDLDGEVVNLFKVLRSSGRQLKQVLSLTPFSRAEFVESYQPTSDSIEQARRTVVRSFMGFGSNAHSQPTGFRSCSNRSGTTPAHDWKNYPDALDALIERLQGVCIENKNAIDVMMQHDSSETLHYVDPPYVFSTRNKGQDYRHELDDNAHIGLFHSLDDLKGMIVLSGYRSELYDDMYSGWYCVQRAARADGASKRIECIWLNTQAQERQRQLSFFCA
jgi:DNA adenine methylase